LDSARPLLERGAGLGKVLFFDCPSGISGDMTLAALLDLGVPRDVFDDVIAALGLTDEAQLIVERGHAGAIAATRLLVEVRRSPPQRSFASIRRLIEASSLSENVARAALAIFERLARAEAEVHGVPLGEVTFHEVGATDSIVDMVGAAAGLDFLGAELVTSPLPMGRGFANTQHGRLPLPAPATLLCLAGVPTLPDPLSVELVTPTGAAIVSTLSQAFVSWPSFIPEQVGWGAGTMVLPDRPNALRAVLGRKAVEADSRAPGERSRSVDRVLLLEANIDDQTGELLSHALGRLLERGALDAWITPIVMKKGRPAFVLSALVEVHRLADVEQAYFDETTTLGVRRRELERTVLDRTLFSVQTRFGAVPIKSSGSPPHQYKPEFDVCVALASEHGVPVRVVLEEALAQARSRR
jgi:uncharacterized protein (TIGR00299 family) protein